MSKKKVVPAVPAVPAVDTETSILIGGRYTTDHRDVIASQVSEFISNDVTTKAAINTLSDRIDPLALIGPNAKLENMYGYEKSIHTPATWRALQTATMHVVLEKESGQFDGYQEILGYVVNLYGKTDIKAPYKSFMNDSGDLVPLVEVMSPGFTAAWGNGELGFHGLRVIWGKLAKAAETKLSRCLKSLAMHTEIVDSTEPTTINGAIFQIPCKVSRIKNETVRKHFDGKKKAQADAREKAAKEKAALSERDTVSKMVSDIIDLMGAVETPTVNQMDVPSRDVVNKHLRAALVDLGKATSVK